MTYQSPVQLTHVIAAFQMHPTLHRMVDATCYCFDSGQRLSVYLADDAVFAEAGTGLLPTDAEAAFMREVAGRTTFQQLPAQLRRGKPVGPRGLGAMTFSVAASPKLLALCAESA